MTDRPRVERMPRSPHSNCATHSAPVPRTASAPPRPPRRQPRRVALRTAATLLVTVGDGAGNTATTWYDALNRPTRTTDSAPSTTTYTYDTSVDPRGLETSRTDSEAGTFTATYLLRARLL
jgi:YD repeat-containing protein